MNEIDRVELSLPAQKEYARLLRLAVAGIASRMNFNYDGVEDLKIGVEEAYLLAINDPKQKRFDLAFEIYPNRLEILATEIRAIGDLEELSQKFGFSILRSVMDEIEWNRVKGAGHLRMVKNIY
ncbi:MAG: hypothetical protein COW32_03455 [Candidatus Aquicultor secundus]|uniref:ATP-binding protein n=2 Tax=Candidatus Aquicultor secundus TaxID=1973895 RepID=A0A2M7T8S7_9ACTN